MDMNVWHDIGDEHFIKFASYKDDPKSGATVRHKKSDGSICDGWIDFDGSAWAQEFNNNITVWQVLSWEPLTLSPSIACRSCGDHGFIRNGKWERA